MGRNINDGRGRLGGRAKGTPNKPQPPFNEWAEGLLSKNRRNIEALVEFQSLTEYRVPLLAALIMAASIDRLTAQLSATGDNDESLNAPEQ